MKETIANNRYVDSNEYLSMVRELVNDGREVRVKIAGSSMAPFLIHERDSVFVTKPKDSKYAVGDILFYQREDGGFVVHRVYNVKPEGLYMIGDGQTEIEGPLPGTCVFGIVKKVCRKDKIIKEGTFTWGFFSKVWIRIIPFRTLVIKMYGLFEKSK